MRRSDSLGWIRYAARQLPAVVVAFACATVATTQCAVQGYTGPNTPPPLPGGLSCFHEFDNGSFVMGYGSATGSAAW